MRYHLTVNNECIYKSSGMSVSNLCPLKNTVYYNAKDSGSYCKYCSEGCKECILSTTD